VSSAFGFVAKSSGNQTMTNGLLMALEIECENYFIEGSLSLEFGTCNNNNNQ
jgi:hypothetical protein